MKYVPEIRFGDISLMKDLLILLTFIVLFAGVIALFVYTLPNG